MLIKEYRILMPLSLNEYQVGRKYSAMKYDDNQGILSEVLINSPFSTIAGVQPPTDQPLLDGRISKGQYKHRIVHLPAGDMYNSEETWDAYPFIRTSTTNQDYAKEALVVNIDTMHLADKGDTENALHLSPELLDSRTIVSIDIADNTVCGPSYKEDEDPALFSSRKTKRGPLLQDWQKKKSSPLMCVYKVVAVEFKSFGLQKTVEEAFHKTTQDSIANFHRRMYCWLDEWITITMVDIQRMEEKQQRALQQKIENGVVKSMRDKSVTQRSAKN